MDYLSDFIFGDFSCCFCTTLRESRQKFRLKINVRFVVRFNNFVWKSVESDFLKDLVNFLDLENKFVWLVWPKTEKLWKCKKLYCDIKKTRQNWHETKSFCAFHQRFKRLWVNYGSLFGFLHRFSPYVHGLKDFEYFLHHSRTLQNFISMRT